MKVFKIFALLALLTLVPYAFLTWVRIGRINFFPDREPVALHGQKQYNITAQEDAAITILTVEHQTFTVVDTKSIKGTDTYKVVLKRTDDYMVSVITNQNLKMGTEVTITRIVHLGRTTFISDIFIK